MLTFDISRYKNGDTQHHFVALYRFVNGLYQEAILC